MDTSETYIKQCAKAWEVQKVSGRYANCGSIWWFKGYNELPEGICAYHRGKGQVVSGMFDEDDWLSLSVAPSYFIWLPGQDQLQEMVGDGRTPFQLSSDFYWWHTNQPWGRQNDLFKSMEQLWLAYVMKEKYNKTWNGKDWGLEI